LRSFCNERFLHDCAENKGIFAQGKCVEVNVPYVPMGFGTGKLNASHVHPTQGAL
jgi:hypothetical protein